MKKFWNAREEIPKWKTEKVEGGRNLLRVIPVIGNVYPLHLETDEGHSSVFEAYPPGIVLSVYAGKRDFICMGESGRGDCFFSWHKPMGFIESYCVKYPVFYATENPESVYLSARENSLQLTEDEELEAKFMIIGAGIESMIPKNVLEAIRWKHEISKTSSSRMKVHRMIWPWS